MPFSNPCDSQLLAKLRACPRPRVKPTSLLPETADVGNTRAPENRPDGPLPGPGDTWDPHMIHTQYFTIGFCVPEAQPVCYLHPLPALLSALPGVVGRVPGLDNLAITDMAFADYQMTDARGQQIEGKRSQRRTVPNPNLHFVEPGRRGQRITYASPDVEPRSTSSTAVTPLYRARPCDSRRGALPGQSPVGSERAFHGA